MLDVLMRHKLGGVKMVSRSVVPFFEANGWTEDNPPAKVDGRSKEARAAKAKKV